MRRNRQFSVCPSIFAKITSLLLIYFFGGQAAQAQRAQQAEPQRQPTAAEMSKKETVASPFLRSLEYQEYEVRSAAEAMPEEKYAYRPAAGKFKSEKPEFGPAEVRTFAQQVKHVACSNFGFAARTAPIPRRPRKNCLFTCATPLPQRASPWEPWTRKTCSIPSKAPTPGPTRGSE